MSGPLAAPIVGMVLQGSDRDFGINHFYEAFVAGLEDAAGLRGASVLLQVVPDAAAERLTYRRWCEQRLVDGVVLHDLVEGDDRAALLRELDIPVAVLGDYLDLPRTVSVDVDNFAATEQALRFLHALGHRRIARVSGPGRLLHTRDRGVAFSVASTSLELSGQVVEGDYSTQSGDRATAGLLSGPQPPTAILYDNDLMALGGLAAAERLGIAVPAAVSLLAWDDSAACRLSRPAVSAMARDLRELGETAMSTLLDLLEGVAARPRPVPAPVVVARETTGPAPV